MASAVSMLPKTIGSSAVGGRSAALDRAAAGQESLCTYRVEGGPRLDIGPEGTGRSLGLGISATHCSLARLEWPEGFHEPQDDIREALVITLLHELRDMPQSLMASSKA